MTLVGVIAAVFVLLLVTSIPRWRHSKEWGFGPCGGVAVIGVLLMFDWLR